MTDLATHFTQALAGLLVVLGLIIVGAYAYNKIRSKGGLSTFLPLSPKGRLRVQETLSLDATRQLVLVERDGQVGHLLLLGAEGEIILESNIPPLPPVNKETSAKKEAPVKKEPLTLGESSIAREPMIPRVNLREVVND
jgi:flagellar biogenesis protein FliO